MEYSETSPSRRWVLHSNPKTAEDLIISLLAIVETVVAVCVYLWVINRFGTYLHLAVAACIAPFLLLRTELSTYLGLRIYGSIQNATTKILLEYSRIRFLKYALVIADMVTISFFAIFSRIIASIAGVIIHPIRSISRIPDNWIRISLCIDIFHPPELVPGDALLESSDSSFNFAAILRVLSRTLKRRTINSILFIVTVLIPFIILGFVPALLYRWSIKGTSIIWLPLLWAASPISAINTEQPEDMIYKQAEDVRYGLLYKMILALSTITMLIGLLKIYLIAEWARLADWWQRTMPAFLDHLIAPLYVYPWHITALANSLLAFFLFFWIDNRVRNPQHYSVQTTASVMKYTLWIRRLLTLYTSANCLWIVLYLADLVTLLPFKWQLFTGIP